MKFLPVLLFLLISTLSVLGQVAPQTEKVGPITQGSQQNQELWKKQQDSLINDSERRLRNLSENSDDLLPPDNFYLAEVRMSKEQKNLVNPNKEQLAQHESFLKNSKTGIVKLLSSPDCGNKMVIDLKDQKCLNRNNAPLSFYSFRKKLYADLPWSDLSYVEQKFTVGFQKLTIGLIREIEEDAINVLTRESEEIKSLSEFSLPKDSQSILNRKQEIKSGIKVGKTEFFDAAAVKLNQTYLLRSYSYKTDADALNDRRIDIIVVFKVVDMDAESNITILWKELYKGDTHKL